MTKLSTKQRNKIPSNEFGLPKVRKYPMPDRAHAKNAEARAAEMKNEGKLSAANKAIIDTKAKAILAKTKSKKS